jgi:hypothetical protein
MDDSLFRKDTYPGEFEARFSVRGSVTRRIKAASAKEAEDAAWAMIEDEDDFLEVDEADDVRLDGIAPRTPMYLITRDGKSMRVSRLQEGDEPREPDERGF